MWRHIFLATVAVAWLARTGRIVDALYEYDFNATSLAVFPAALDTAVEIQLTIEPMIDLVATDNITVALPRFSAGADISQLKMNTNYFLRGSWTEGTLNASSTSTPYPDSKVTLTVLPSQTLTRGSIYHIFIYKENGIQLLCDIAANDDTYTIATDSDATDIANTALPIETVSGVGPGCAALNDCNGHGDCNACTRSCTCWEGYRFGDSRLASLNVACAERTCPLGVAFADVPTTSSEAHANAECSNVGLCDRSTGECRCFPGFEGESCQRKKCHRDCSGHGQCLDMAKIATETSALPLSNNTNVYGSLSATGKTAWDHAFMSACLCDSSWPVGLASGETQEAEYFGPDCSLKHCPSGDDPETSADETDCSGVTAAGGLAAGRDGNLCHVDCSNRGVCDFKTGNCQCFAGYAGEACGTRLKWTPRP